MGHETFRIIQTPCLILSQLDIHSRFKIIDICRKDSSFPVANLADIRSKPNSFPSFHLGNGQFFQALHRNVEVADFTATDHIPQHLNCVGLAIRLVCRRRIDNRNVVLQLKIHIFFVKALRCQARLCVEVIVLIAIRETKCTRGQAQ